MSSYSKLILLTLLVFFIIPKAVNAAVYYYVSAVSFSPNYPTPSSVAIGSNTTLLCNVTVTHNAGNGNANFDYWYQYNTSSTGGWLNMSTTDVNFTMNTTSPQTYTTGGSDGNFNTTGAQAKTGKVGSWMMRCQGWNYRLSQLLTGNIINITVTDGTPPTYSLNSTNSTVNGTDVKFSLQANDDTALQTNGQYIFGFDNCTGTFTNDSAVNFTATPSWMNVTKRVNSTAGCTIRYYWNFTDNANNRNASSVSSPFSFTTIASISKSNTQTFSLSNGQSQILNAKKSSSAALSVGQTKSIGMQLSLSKSSTLAFQQASSKFGTVPKSMQQLLSFFIYGFIQSSGTTSYKQIWYDPTTGLWYANVTMPSASAGTYHLYLQTNETQNDILKGDTQLSSIIYGGISGYNKMVGILLSLNQSIQRLLLAMKNIVLSFNLNSIMNILGLFLKSLTQPISLILNILKSMVFPKFYSITFGLNKMPSEIVSALRLSPLQTALSSYVYKFTSEYKSLSNLLSALTTISKFGSVSKFSNLLISIQSIFSKISTNIKSVVNLIYLSSGISRLSSEYKSFVGSLSVIMDVSKFASMLKSANVVVFMQSSTGYLVSIFRNIQSFFAVLPSYLINVLQFRSMPQIFSLVANYIPGAGGILSHSTGIYLSLSSSLQRLGMFANSFSQIVNIYLSRFDYGSISNSLSNLLSLLSSRLSSVSIFRNPSLYLSTITLTSRLEDLFRSVGGMPQFIISNIIRVFMLCEKGVNCPTGGIWITGGGIGWPAYKAAFNVTTTTTTSVPPMVITTNITKLSNDIRALIDGLVRQPMNAYLIIIIIMGAVTGTYMITRERIKSRIRKRFGWRIKV